MLSILILLSLVASTAVASDVDDTKNTEAAFADAVSYTCEVDDSTGKIVVEGTVNHDVMIKYADYTIRLYAIAPGQKADEVINNDSLAPLAQTSMTIKFTFSITAKTTLERYSKYAIIFCSESGREYVAGTPMYPSVSSDFDFLYGDKHGYKGVLCESASLSSGVGAGMVVVDVDLGSMLGDIADAVLYPIKDTYIPFCKSYVDELDRKIVSASVGGAKIYLRFLLGADDERLCFAVTDDGSMGGIPNVYDEYTLDYIASLSKFLMDRYNDGNVRLEGVIIGNKVDDTLVSNYIGDMTAGQYADAYVLYLTVVASAMRAVDTSFDVVIPISDRDEYSPKRTEGTSTSDFLNYVISQLEHSTSGRFECSVMLQSTTTPFGITNLGIASGIDMSAEYGEGTVHPDNVSHFINYIQKLSNTYVSAPSNVIFMWEPSSYLSGSALNAAYAYIFYRLYGETAISSFVIKADDTDQLDELSNVMRYIDTSRGNMVTEPLLKYFGKNSWQDVVGRAVIVTQIQTLLEAGELSGATPENYRSSFSYYDFSDYNVFHNTHIGENCNSIYSTHDSHGARALNMSIGALDIGQTAECTYDLDYTENFTYTPVISLSLRLDNGAADSGALYELILTLGKGNSRIICTALIEAGKDETVFFDVSGFSKKSSADYVKIGVRALTQKAEACNLWLYGLDGYSNEYSDEELAELIEQQRYDQKNTDGDNAGGGYRILIMVVSILFALLAVGAGLLMVFRREDGEKRHRKE